MRIFLFFSFVPILFGGCKDKDDSGAPNLYAARILAQLNPTDSFLYEVPRHKKTKWDSMDLEIQRRNLRCLKLESLERGFDSIQIRISYGCPLGPGDLIVVLKNRKSKWEAEMCKVIYPPTWQHGGDSISRIIFKDPPKSGWTKFINRLFDLSILTLPDEKQLKNLQYSVPMDGCWVEVEIATKKVYREYGYGNPDMYDGDFLEARNILSVLNLINEEFGVREKFKIRYMWPDDGRNEYPKDTVQQPPVEHEIQLQDIKEDSTQH